MLKIIQRVICGGAAAPETWPSRYLHQNRAFVRDTMFWSGRGAEASVAGQQTRTCAEWYSTDQLTNQHLKA
jgi:hypothetical protein